MWSVHHLGASESYYRNDYTIQRGHYYCPAIFLDALLSESDGVQKKQVFLTKCDSLRKLDGIPNPSTIDSCNSEPVSSTWDKVFHHKLSIAHWFCMARLPKSTVHLPNLYSVSQDWASTITERCEPGQSH